MMLRAKTERLSASVHCQGRLTEIDASGVDPADVEYFEEAELLVLGEPWRSVVLALADLPDASTATPREELERLALVVAGRLREWLRHIGFSFEPLEDGGRHFGLARPHQWMLPIEGFDTSDAA